GVTGTVRPPAPGMEPGPGTTPGMEPGPGTTPGMEPGPGTTPGTAPGPGRVLPATPRRHHPAGIVFLALSVGVRDLLVVAALVLSTGWWWLLVAGPVVGLGVSALRWWRTRWWLDDDRIVVDRALLRRTHRELPV